MKPTLQSIRSAVLAIVLLAAAAQVVAQDDYNTWQYRRSMWLNTRSTGANVAGTVSNFPVLVRLNPGNFDGFTNTADNGSDIRFATAAGTHLRYQIERWTHVSATVDTAEIWVLMPTVNGNDSLGNSVIMYWGKVTAADSSSGPAVFSPADGFMDVLHLENAPADGAAFNDASGSGNTATANNFQNATDLTGTTNAPGVIGRGARLDTTDDYMRGGNVRPPNSMTASLWVYLARTPTGGEWILMGRKDETGGLEWDAFQLYIQWGSLRPVFHWVNNIDTVSWYEAASGMSTGAWHHIAAQREGAVLRMYIDGQQSTGGPTGPYAPSGTMATYGWGMPIGAENGASRHFHGGYLDEIRIDSVARSADWIRLCYQNQQPTQNLVVQGASSPNYRIAWWDFNNGETAPIDSSFADSIAAQISPSSPSTKLSWGPGMQPENALRFWASHQDQTTLAGAIAGNKYFTFTLTPQTACTLGVSSIRFIPYFQNDAVVNMTLMSSARGFTEGNQIATQSALCYYCTTPVTFNVPGHENITSATEFRVYLWGGANFFESRGIFDVSGADLIVQGSARGTPTGKTWNGSVSGDWNTAANWTPSGVPNGTDNVLLNGSAPRNCTLSTAVAVASLQIQGDSLYTSTSNYAITSGSVTITGGNLTASASTITVSGNFTVANTSGLFTRGTSTVDLTGSANLSNPNGGNAFHRLKTAAATRTTTCTGVFQTHFLEVGAGTLALAGYDGHTVGVGSAAGDKLVTASASSSALSGNWLYINVPNSGIVTMDGYAAGGSDIIIQGGSGTLQLVTRALSGLSWIDMRNSGTFDAGGFNVTINGELNVGMNTNSPSFLCQGGTISVNSLLMESTTGAPTLDLGTGIFNCATSFNVGRVGNIVTPGTSRVVFNGTSGTNAIRLYGQSLNAVDFNGSGATYQLVDSLHALGDVRILAGTLNLNGQNLRTDGNLTVSNGRSTTFSGLAGCRVTVGGAASLSGQSGNLLNLNTASAHYLAVSGTLSASYANIGWSKALLSTGTAASTCTDAGNDSNWAFVGPAACIWDGGGADSNWNTALNWSGDAVPGSGDTAVFDATSNKPCILNTSGIVRTIRFTSSHTGAFTFGNYSLSVDRVADFRSGGAVTAGSGTLQLMGAGSTFYPDTGMVLRKLKFDQSASATVAGIGFSADTLDIDTGSLNLGVGLTDSVGKALVTGPGGTGTLNMGSSVLKVSAGIVNLDALGTLTPGSGTLAFTGTGPQTYTPDTAVVVNAILQSGAGGTTLNMYRMRATTFSMSAGSWDWTGCSPDTVGSMSVGGGSMAFGGSTVRVTTGNADFNGATSLSSTSGTLVFAGTSGTQLFTPKRGLGFPNITKENAGIVQLAGSGALRANALNVNGGTWNWNGVGADTVASISTAGSATMSFGASRVVVNGGDANLSGLGTLTAGSGSLVFARPTQPQAFTPKAGQTHPSIEQQGAGGTTNLAGALSAGSLTIGAGTFALGANSCTVTSVASSGGGLDLGSGLLIASSGGMDLSGLNTTFGGGGKLQFSGSGARTLRPANTLFMPVSEVTLLAGFSGTVNVTDTLLAGCVRVAAGTLNLGGSAYVHRVDSLIQTAGTVGFGSATLQVSGNATFGGAATAGTGTLALSGSSGTQVLTPPTSGSLPALTHATAGTLQLATRNLASTSMLQSGTGVLSLSGRNISTTGDFTLSGGHNGTLAGLDNRKITVGGKAKLSGQSGNLLNLNSASPCTLAVVDSLQATYANIANNKATNHYGLAAGNCTNGGSNYHWVFGGKPGPLSYLTNPALYTRTQAITANTLTNSGGAADSFTVSPALPAGLSIAPASGTISGTPTATTSGAVVYKVKGWNLAGVDSVNLTLTVNPLAPNINYSVSNLVCTAGVAIAAVTMTNGGDAMDSIRVSPALPTGLALNPASGQISGTPSAVAASQGYTVTAYNRGGTSQQVLTIMVKRAPPGVLSYQRSPLVCTSGVAIVIDSLRVSGGGAIDSFTVQPPLPTGLAFGRLTGHIDGAPTDTSVAATDHTVYGWNESGVRSVVLSIQVKRAPPGPLSYATPTVAYVRDNLITPNTVSNFGGRADSYTVSPALPPGLTINPVSGTLSGTPTTVQAVAQYVVHAVNESGEDSTVLRIRIDLNVVPPLISYSPSVVVDTIGIAMQHSLINSGSAIDSIQISPAAGVLSAVGIAFDPLTGQFSGTPTATLAPTTFTLTGYNEAGNNSTQLELSVVLKAPGPLVYAPDSAVYTVGVMADTGLFNVTNAGGVIDSFTVSPALPAGLRVDRSIGVVRGTPTLASAAWSWHVVSAHNAAGVARDSIRLRVRPATPGPLAYVTNPLSCTVGTAIVVDSLLNGGGAADSFTVSPALPRGLVFSGSSGAISGTPDSTLDTTLYTVSGRNETGLSQAVCTLWVRLPPPGPISYAVNPAIYVVGRAIVPNTASNAGGRVSRYRALEALPAGLSLDSLTGTLSGTPSAALAAAQYTIEAGNATASATVQLTVSVVDSDAVVNPLRLSGSFVDTQHVRLSFSGYSALPSTPDQYNPYVDTIGVWYRASGYHAAPQRGESVFVALRLADLQAVAEPYELPLGVATVPSGSSYYYFSATAFWHHPDSLPPFVAASRDSVYMIDTAAPANKLTLALAYVDNSDTVKVSLSPVDSIDTLRAALVRISFSRSADMSAPFMNQTLAADSVVGGAVAGLFEYGASSPVFSGLLDTVWCSVALVGYNGAVSLPLVSSVVVGKPLAANPITLEARALNWHQIALYWNDISASGADSLRLSWDTLAIPLGVQQVSTPWVQYYGVGTLADTLDMDQARQRYYFAAQARIGGLWTAVSAAASATDSTLELDTTLFVPNSVDLVSVMFDATLNRLIVNWRYNFKTSLAVHYGYVVGTDSTTTTGQVPTTWRAASDSILTTYIPLGEDILFDTVYYVSFRLKRADKDASYASPAADSAIKKVRTGPISWEPICYFRSVVGDTVWAFNHKVALWYEGNWTYGWTANRDTLDVYRAIPTPTGFIPVSVGFRARVNLDFQPITMALAWDSIPAGMSAADIRVYRRTAGGLWMVLSEHLLSGAPGMVSFHSKFLPGEVLMLMIDTLPPQDSVLSDLTRVLSTGSPARDTVQLSDNCANMRVQFLFSRAELRPVALPDSTLSQTTLTYTTSVPGLYVTETGLRAYLVVSDGRYSDTVNISRQVRRGQASDVSAEAGMWVPLRTTELLDNDSAAPMLQALLGSRTYDPYRARLFRWYEPLALPADTNRWVEYGSGADSTFALVPGRLMWIKVSETKLLDFGGGVTTSLRDTFEATLAPQDWTDLAVPYRFSVFMGDIRASSGAAVVDSLQFYRWEQSAGRYTTQPLYIAGLGVPAYRNGRSPLNAGSRDGYSVYNPASVPVVIRIPPVCTLMSAATVVLPKQAAQTSGGWALQVHGWGWDGGALSNMVCAYRQAATGPAVSYFPLAPSFSPLSMRLAAPEQGRQYAHAVVHRLDGWGGVSYELLLSNAAEQPEQVRLAVDGLEELPQSFEAQLVDPHSGTLQPLDRQIAFSVPAKGQVSRTIAVGGPGYFRHLLLGVKPFAQLAAFPNPFRGKLNVQFLMPQSAKRVEAALYSISGRQVWNGSVKPLLGQLTRLSWDARSSRQMLAAGNYILRLQAFDTTGKLLKSVNLRLVNMP